MIRPLAAVSALLLLCGCNLNHSIDRADVKSWNESGVWVPLPGSRSDYVPSDFRRHPSSNPSEGQWVADPQDGMRFYVPAKGTHAYPAGVLRGEALKATNRQTLAEQKTHNVVNTAMSPVYFATFGLTNPAVWKAMGEPSGMSGDPAPSDTTASDTSNSTSCDNNKRTDGQNHGKGDACKGVDGGHHGR